MFPAFLQNDIISLSVSNANESKSFSLKPSTGAAGQFDILA